MKAVRTAISDVVLLEPKVFGDARGFFLESYNARTLQDVLGLDCKFVQDNHSRSSRGVLRGLHYQLKKPQGKLIRVVSGSIFDVAVDVRTASPTFGRWVGAELSGEHQRQIWIPPGFAHGFVVLSESADVIYKATDYYAPEHERCIAWNDPAIGIKWPWGQVPILSEKDQRGLALSDAEVFT